MESEIERLRSDRRELLEYILAINSKIVVTPLDGVNYDSIDVKYVLDRARKGLTMDIAAAFNSPPPQENNDTVLSTSPVGEEIADGGSCPSVEAPFKFQGEQIKNADEIALCLPAFETGLSDDDIRETAYEVLLASVGAAGGLMKKEESVSRSGKWKPQSKASGLACLMSIMRKQLEITVCMGQISEENDKRTTDALFHASSGRLGKRTDSLLVPLELLCNTKREIFPDGTTYLNWQKRLLNIVREGVLNNYHWNLDRSDHLAMELMASIANVETSAFKDRTDALKRVKDVYLAISGRNGKSEEPCHWADGYYLNVRLYEKLLFGIFDPVNSSQFIEEAEELLELLKSTWRVLGLNQIVHDTCFTWVIFKQFVVTGEFFLLQHAQRQMKLITFDRPRTVAERAYLKTTKHGNLDVSYVQAVLGSIKSWIDKQLNDYHLYFQHDRTKMEAVLAIVVTSARLLTEEETKAPGISNTLVIAKLIEGYISSSIKEAYARVHTKKLADYDITFFSPLLCRWGPLSVAVTASVLHAAYFKELKPCLERLSTSPDDEVTSLLYAADNLEQYLLDLVTSAENGDGKVAEYKAQMIPYELDKIPGNWSMRCITTKFEELSNGVESAFMEENWEPLSPEERYGRSASDIFKAIDKVVDSFFGIEFPIRASHIKNLIDALENAVQLYSDKLHKQLGDKADLIPPAPALTRHKKEISIKVFSKRKVSDPHLPDEKRSSELNALTTAKLCMRLNTLHFVLHQLNLLQENIKQKWLTKRAQYCSGSQIKSKQSEEILPGFETSKKFVTWVLEQTCEFTGFKLIFWDMREAYVDTLYKGNVGQCRIEKVVNGLDTALGQLCEVLVEPLRDQVVFGLLEASLEGFLWVLLDGGPFRSFSQADTEILEQDLNILKDFFVADGDGLPRVTVNNAASQVHQILNLYRLEPKPLRSFHSTSALTYHREDLYFQDRLYLQARAHEALVAVGRAFRMRRVPCHLALVSVKRTLHNRMAQENFQLLKSVEDPSQAQHQEVAVEKKPVTFRVPRTPEIPRELLATKPKDRIDELLVLEGIDIPGCKLVLDVYLNLPIADENMRHDIAEYVGSFYCITPRRSDQKFSIRSNLEMLELDNAKEITVTVVPRGGCHTEVPIRGANIVYA
ncbi:hypothetical protein SELMODRAFT_402753 [Selaginella moellendorffii]|uniref:MHD1 domain-containing protein n=1 Tax=Selaginella moellendorffii TaxID=88036 RepID=D8QMY4_SELML|nr:hypothetical protein SELMODRAFT_402753 [Selaginella moellendorffii]